MMFCEVIDDVFTYSPYRKMRSETLHHKVLHNKMLHVM